MSTSEHDPELRTVICNPSSLPPDRDERILQALRGLGVSGDLGAVFRTPEGRPYLPRRPEVRFSVSHSGDLWLCALCRQPVGADIQKIVDCPRERLARRFFHPDETAWLEANDFRDFFRVWTAKESYLKCVGRGLFAGLNSFSVIRDGVLSAPEGCTLRRMDCPEGYEMAVTWENR